MSNPKGKAPPLPSDRSFGFTIGGALTFFGAILWWRGRPAAPWFFAGAVAFTLFALVLPGALRPLNRVWMAFGALLNKIVSPVVLGVIFLVVFTPVALLFRVIKRDTMKRSFDKSMKSYWINREPPGPAPESFPQQF